MVNAIKNSVIRPSVVNSPVISHCGVLLGVGCVEKQYSLFLVLSLGDTFEMMISPIFRIEKGESETTIVAIDPPMTLLVIKIQYSVNKLHLQISISADVM